MYLFIQYHAEILAYRSFSSTSIITVYTYYHRTQQLQEQLATSEPGSYEYKAADDQLQITQDAMDHFELEMRISTMPLSELTPETDLKDIFNHLKMVSINAEEE